MKLSIVIPVYRVEATLQTCIESVVSQDYDNFELILVDDGSPDKCPQICDQWAAKDKRIRVIHQKNRGLSDARNSGIDQAKGEYITFVDSDDFVGEHTYAPLMDYLETHPETDILEYEALLYCGSPKEQELNFPKTKVYHDMEDYWFSEKAYEHAYAWNKIYRATLFQHARFPTDVVFEDICTLHRLLKHTQTFTVIGEGRYYYCFNPEGITATADGKALRMHLIHHLEILRDTERRDAAFQRYYLKVLNIQIDLYALTADEPILPEIHLNTSCFKGKEKIKAFSLNMLGIRTLCKLLTLNNKLWKRPTSASS